MNYNGYEIKINKIGVFNSKIYQIYQNKVVLKDENNYELMFQTYQKAKDYINNCLRE